MGLCLLPYHPISAGQATVSKCCDPSSLASFTSLSQIPNIAVEEGRVHFGSGFEGTLHCSREDMAVGAHLVTSHPHPWLGSRERDAGTQSSGHFPPFLQSGTPDN